MHSTGHALPLNGLDDLLVEQLSRRFTPVHSQSLQSSLFHHRKQGAGGNSRYLCPGAGWHGGSLFRREYPPAQRGSEEAKTVGRAVLANHFLAGLQPELKSKLVGQEGIFNQL